MTTKLNLDEKTSRLFDLSVRLQKAKNPEFRQKLLEQMQESSEQMKQTRDLSVDQFKLISEWYHFPMLMLMELENFPWTTANVAKSLNISALEVQQALDRMISLDLIELDQNQVPKKIAPRVKISSELDNEALKKFHVRMLEKTIEAQKTYSPTQRFTGTSAINLAPSQLKDAEAILLDCAKRLRDLTNAKNTVPTEVYHLGLNLFPVTRNADQSAPSPLSKRNRQKC